MDQIPTVEINNLRDYNNRLVCLPKYWVVLMTEDNKEQFIEHVISYLDEIDHNSGSSWLDNLNPLDFNVYYGFDGNSSFNGTNSYCLEEYEEFENNPTILTLEEFIELRNKMKDKNNINNSENKPFSFKKCLMSINDMLEYKNKQYGESALKPLDIFAKHHPYGSRLDEKLARVKNSQILRKNDVSDLIGGLILICKDRGWEDFSDLCD